MGKTGIIPIKAGAQGEEGHQERSGHDGCCFERDVTEDDPKIRVRAGGLAFSWGWLVGHAEGEQLARPRRFERPTPAFGGQYSIQLSYGRQGVPRTGFAAQEDHNDTTLGRHGHASL